MFTSKSARALAADSRRRQRERDRRAREAAKKFKEQQKILLIENIRQAVEDYKDYIEVLLSVHKECDDPVDWEEIKNESQPEEPVYKPENTESATLKLTGYKPGLIDRIFLLTKKKTAKLREQVKLAEEMDKAKYERDLQDYNNELNRFNRLKEIASGIENREHKYYTAALDFFEAFTDIDELGTQMSFEFEEGLFDVSLIINGTDIIPDYELSQTSTGKLSKKDMAKGKFYELYQDHICSAVIRVARDVFAYLPLQQIRINAMSELLNPASGHLELVPVLSVIVTRDTLDKLNLETIDPSSSMQNFVHTMNFKKTAGFTAVEKVRLSQ